MVALAAIAGAVLVPSAPASADTLELAAASDWELREYDDKCRIARDFGAGEDAVTLWIDKGGPGPSVNLTFIGRPLRDPYGPTVRLGFGDGDKVERSYIKVTSSSGRPVLALFGVQPMTAVPPMGEPASDIAAIAGDEEVNFTEAVSAEADPAEKWMPERLSALGSIKLEWAIPNPLSLDLGGFPDAMTQLLACTDDLTERLKRREGGTIPEPEDQEEWARDIIDDYPAHLLRENEEGSVSVRLTIGKTGRVSFCEVTDFSGPESFNETACLNLLKHARFKPARDPQGKAVPGFWYTRITYLIRN